MTLDYRSPVALSPREQRVLQRLSTSEGLGYVVIVIKLIAGTVLCLIGPLFVSALVDDLGADAVFGSSWMTFGMVSLIVVPLLMWLERRTRGEFFSDAVRGSTNPLRASSVGEFELSRYTFLWKVYTELALLGPRLLWDVIDRLRGCVPDNVRLRAVAAQIVVELLDAGQGVQLRELLRADRPVRQLLDAAQFLKQHDWIDVSARRDRIWLTENARKKLLAISRN